MVAVKTEISKWTRDVVEAFHILPDPLQRSLHPPCCECGLFLASFSRELPSAEQKPLHPDYIPVHHDPQVASGQWLHRVQKVGFQGGWGWRSILQSNVYSADSHGTRLQRNFSQDHILSSSLALSCCLHSPFLKDTLSISYLHRICKSRDPYLSQK